MIVAALSVQCHCQDRLVPVATRTLRETLRRSVAAAAGEPNAPCSAWPERYPGRWATATRVAEICGRRVAEVSYHLRELVDEGWLVTAEPWPSGTRGYQLRQQAPHLFLIEDEIEDEREWLLDQLRRWASLNNGRPPRQIDWSKANDPQGEWPRWDRVRDYFEAEALEQGLRYFQHQRCGDKCSCSTGQHYTNNEGDTYCDGCFECRGECPHGANGEWIGPSGWRYALELAGLA